MNLYFDTWYKVLVDLANQGITVSKITLPTSDYLRLACALRIKEQGVPRRFVFIPKDLAMYTDTMFNERTEEVQVSSSFQFIGPTGSVVFEEG